MGSKRLKLVCGWGMNDVDYTIAVDVKTDKGKKQVMCPYYRKWKNMIVRVFNEKEHERYPNYKGCTICEEWKYLSKFIEWVNSQPNKDWQNCDLDKDLLLSGNKHYSPNTCVFVSKKVNYFTLSGGAKRGQYLIGVSKQGNKFYSCVKNPENNKTESLGSYSTEIEAHIAWQSRKHELACLLAKEQPDPRVAEALRTRYAPDKDWTKA